MEPGRARRLLGAMLFLAIFIVTGDEIYTRKHMPYPSRYWGVAVLYIVLTLMAVPDVLAVPVGYFSVLVDVSMLFGQTGSWIIPFLGQGGSSMAQAVSEFQTTPIGQTGGSSGGGGRGGPNAPMTVKPKNGKCPQGYKLMDGMCVNEQAFTSRP